jgi:hypothetical protein
MFSAFARLAFAATLVACLARADVRAQTTAAPARATVEGELACGGEARDVPCTLALFFQCAARQSDEVCARVGLAEIPKLVEQPQPLDYAIDRTSTIRPEDVTEELKHLAWYRPGFLLVEAEARRCPAAGSCADEEWSDWQIYLRADEGRFFVVYWRGDSEPETTPDIPDAFVPGTQPPPDPDTPR